MERKAPLDPGTARSPNLIELKLCRYRWLDGQYVYGNLVRDDKRLPITNEVLSSVQV